MGTAPVLGTWLWIAFLVSWWAAALWTSRAISHGRSGQQIAYFLGFGLGFALLFDRAPMPGRAAFWGPDALLPHGWQAPLWHDPAWLAAALLAIEIVAFAFAWWARVHLGRLWSGMLTLREGHRVVDTGPYALVRHPIYTGFIAASWALALLDARLPVALGALVLTIVMTVKAGTEERLLARELGPASYDAYRRRVPMLVPFVRPIGG